MRNLLTNRSGMAILAIAGSIFLSGCTETPPKRTQTSMHLQREREAAARKTMEDKRRQEAAHRKAAEEERRQKDIDAWKAAQAKEKAKKEAEQKAWLAAYKKERAAKKVKAEARWKELRAPVREAMKELPVSVSAESIIIQPATLRTDEKVAIEKALKEHRHYTHVKPPYPSVSRPFAVEAFTGTIAAPRQGMAVTKDGTIILATSDGGYLIGDKDTRVIGQGKNCTAVAVSPTGDIAFAFAYSKPLAISYHFPGQESWTSKTSGLVIEIHVIDKDPYVILLGQCWRGANEGVSSLSFNADGSALGILSFPDDLTVLTGGRAWAFTTKLSANRIGWGVEFHPTNPRQLLCCGYRVDLGTDDHCTRTLEGGSACYAPDGTIISAQKDWEDLWFEMHDGTRSGRMQEYRHIGVDRIVVGDKVIAYTTLNWIHVWDRQSQKVIHSLRNTEADGWSPGYVNSLAWRGAHLVVASHDGQLVEWDPTTGKRVRTIIAAHKAATTK